MAEMRTIEIGFEVHKKIELERMSFSESPNDVLIRLLSLSSKRGPQSEIKGTSAGRAWSGKGASLPHGTDVRMDYNGRQHSGRIDDGKWVFGAQEYDSPSAAASGEAKTKQGYKTQLDGWKYWEVRLPNEAEWILLRTLRKYR